MIEDDHSADHPLKRRTCSGNLHRAADLRKRSRTGDRESWISDRDHFPDAAVAVAFQPRERDVDASTYQLSASDSHDRTDIMRTSAAKQRRGRIGRPVEQTHCQSRGNLGRAEFPRLMALIDLDLIGFGLVARDIGEQAGEDRLHQCPYTLRPFELAEKVCRHSGDRFARVERGEFVGLGSHHCIVVADLCITLHEPHHLKDFGWVSIRDGAEDEDIQCTTLITATNGHQGLERGSTHEVGATDQLDVMGTTIGVVADDRLPIGGGSYMRRAGLRAKHDTWRGRGSHSQRGSNTQHRGGSWVSRCGAVMERIKNPGERAHQKHGEQNRSQRVQAGPAPSSFGGGGRKGHRLQSLRMLRRYRVERLVLLRVDQLSRNVLSGIERIQIVYEIQ